MMELGGYMGKIVIINLTTREINETSWSNEYKKNILGGKWVAIDFISRLVSSDKSPYDEENVIVISTGPLNLTDIPASNRFYISTISLLSNQLVSSNCGGDFGLKLKSAGIDALIIKGIAKNPTWIDITDGNIQFIDARFLWGMKTFEANEKLNSYNKNSGQLVIGPASENKVLISEVFSKNRRISKYGVGAVFGVKNLKAITVFGNNKPKIVFLNELNKLNWGNSIDTIKSSDRNLKYIGCVTCPTPCGKVIIYKGTIFKEKEFKDLRKLSIKLGDDDFKNIILWKKINDEMGMDIIDVCQILNGLQVKVNEITQCIYDIGNKKIEVDIKDCKNQKEMNEEKYIQESISSLGICQIALKNNDVALYIKALNLVTGLDLTAADLKEIGQKITEIEIIYNEKRRRDGI